MYVFDTRDILSSPACNIHVLNIVQNDFFLLAVRKFLKTL